MEIRNISDHYVFFQVLTKDSLSIVVDAVVYAKISNVRTGALSGVNMFLCL